MQSHTFSLSLSLQVEEKPDVTYGDVGGCKEQIEKLKEVVETPLLHVNNITHDDHDLTPLSLPPYSQRSLSN